MCSYDFVILNGPNVQCQAWSRTEEGDAKTQSFHKQQSWEVKFVVNSVNHALVIPCLTLSQGLCNLCRWIVDDYGCVIRELFQFQSISVQSNSFFTFATFQKSHVSRKKLRFCSTQLAFPAAVQEWTKIPKDVDVLITHTPPFQILDQSQYNGKFIGAVLRGVSGVPLPKNSVQMCSVFHHFLHILNKRKELIMIWQVFRQVFWQV